MADLTPQQAARRLRTFSVTGLPAAVREAAAQAAPIVAGTSVGQFMADAKGGGRRRADDRGALRILSGTLARAVASPHGRAGSIREVTAEGSGSSLSITLTMGVRPSVAGGAYNEGRAAKSGVSLSFLQPAAEASRSKIAKRAATIIRKAFASEFAGVTP